MKRVGWVNGMAVEISFDVPPEVLPLLQVWDSPEYVMRRKAEKKKAAPPPARKAS
jgi:hypothetical protein